MINRFKNKIMNLPKAQKISLGLIGLGFALLIIAIIILFSTRNRTQSSANASTSLGQKHIAVIQITTSGFIPSTIKIKPNTEVTWVNEDTAPHIVASDPYPTHTDLPSLVSPKALGNKETYTYLFTKPNTIHYHDDLHPLLSGLIQVK